MIVDKIYKDKHGKLQEGKIDLALPVCGGYSEPCVLDNMGEEVHCCKINFGSHYVYVKMTFDEFTQISEPIEK